MEREKPFQFVQSSEQLTPWEEYLFRGLHPSEQVRRATRLRRVENFSRFNLLENRFGKLEDIEIVQHNQPTFEEALKSWRMRRAEWGEQPFKVLLINAPDDPDGVAAANKGAYPPLNLWRIGTWAKMKGADVRLADGTVKTEEEIKRIIEEYQPDILGVSVLVASTKSGINLSAFAKEKCNSIVCWGNDHPSQNVKETLGGRSMVDVILRGDGADRWFGDLIEVMRDERDIATVSSASWRIKGGIRNTVYEVYEMNEIPIVDSSLISPEEYQVYTENFRQKWGKWFPEGTVPGLINIVRGCHWGGARCSYCDIADLSLRAITNYERIWNEIDMLNKEYGVNLIYEAGDNFTSFVRPTSEVFKEGLGVETTTGDTSWSQGLLGARPPHLKDIKWFVYGRADDIVRPGIIDMLKEIGVARINMGLDHFDDRILLNGNSINKGSNGETNRRAVELMAKHGIQGHFSFVVGAPGETQETLETLREGILYTIRTMGSLIATLDISPLMPFKGSTIYNKFYFHENKEIRNEFRELFGDADVADNEAMTRYTIEHACSISYDEVIFFTNWVYSLIKQYGYVPGGLGLPAEKDEKGKVYLK